MRETNSQSSVVSDFRDIMAGRVVTGAGALMGKFERIAEYWIELGETRYVFVCPHQDKSVHDSIVDFLKNITPIDTLS